MPPQDTTITWCISIVTFCYEPFGDFVISYHLCTYKMKCNTSSGHHCALAQDTTVHELRILLCSSSGHHCALAQDARLTHPHASSDEVTGVCQLELMPERAEGAIPGHPSRNSSQHGTVRLV